MDDPPFVEVHQGRCEFRHPKTYNVLGEISLALEVN